MTSRSASAPRTSRTPPWSAAIRTISGCGRQATTVEALGFEKIVYFDIDAKPVFSADALDMEEGAEEVMAAQNTRMAARFDANSGMQVGDEVEAAVTIGKAHFFDPETGLAIRD